MNNSAVSMIPACTTPYSRFSTAVVIIMPEAGQREHDLGHHRAAQHAAELQADHGDQRHQDVAHAVHPDDAPLGSPRARAAAM